MRLPPHVAALVEEFRAWESDDARGPAFKAVALALELLMREYVVTPINLLECFGPPDLFDENGWVYFFDHDEARQSDDEWYFSFDGDRLAHSGYNDRGVNDLSGMRDRAHFRIDDWLDA